jgi:hypothetical protein
MPSLVEHSAMRSDIELLSARLPRSADVEPSVAELPHQLKSRPQVCESPLPGRTMLILMGSIAEGPLGRSSMGLWVHGPMGPWAHGPFPSKTPRIPCLIPGISIQSDSTDLGRGPLRGFLRGAWAHGSFPKQESMDFEAGPEGALKGPCGEPLRVPYVPLSSSCHGRQAVVVAKLSWS